MILKIEHATNYHFSSEVFLEPHRLYFYPLFRHYFNLISFNLEINPSPKGISHRLDAENNAYHQVWFQELTDQLSIKMAMEVETKDYNPLDFIVDTLGRNNHNEMLKIYLNQSVSVSTLAKDWITKLFKKSEGNSIAFLSSLCSELYSGWDHEIRYESNLLHPNESFRDKKGSCRDLSWLLINLLRYRNIPARFVSGYAFNPDLGEGHELHAWVEAWLPGPGWVGIDPSSGLFTTSNYIPVSVSYQPSHTLPVQGSFRGKADSKLETALDISIIT